MNVLAIMHFIMFLADICLIFLVLFRNPRALLNRICALLFLTLAIWSFSFARIHISDTFFMASLWTNISSIGWILFPAISFYFYLVLTGKKRFYNSPIFIVFLMVAAFFIYEQWTGNMVSIVLSSFGWSAAWAQTPVTYLFFTYYCLTIVTGISILWRFGKAANTINEKQQVIVLFCTAITSLVLGVLTDVIFPMARVANMPQMSDMFVSIWGCGIFISIARYGLMSVSPATASDQIVSTMSEALLLLDARGNISMSNSAAHALLEAGEADIRGKSLVSFIENKRDFEALLSEATLKNESSNREISIITAGKREIPTLVSISTVKDKFDTVAGFVIVARDITQRKEFEQKLTESEAYLRNIFDSVPAGIMLIDEETHTIEEANNLAVKMIGTDRSKIIGSNCQKFICFADKGQCPITDLHQKIDNSERKLRTADGKVIDVLKNVVSIERNGRRQLLEIVVDINERKRAEVAIQESEEKYRAIFESVSDILLLIDEQGTIRDVNRRIKDLGLYEKEDLLGKNIGSLAGVISEQSLSTIVANFMKRAKGEIIPLYEADMRKKNGEAVNVEVNAVFISKNGKFIGDLAILRDITERKKAENAIKAQKELIDRILSTTPSSVLVIGKDTKLIMANRSFYKTFGKTEAEVEGKPIGKVINKQGLIRAVDRIRAGTVANVRTEFDYTLSGNTRSFLADILDMQENEVLVILTDITEEKARQDRWLLTDRMASIGEMASGIAHELNNPLTGVIALSQLLAEEKVPPDIRDDLKCICSEAQRAAAVVRNLLTFARKHTPEKKLVQLNSVVEDVLKLRAYEHKINNIRVKTMFDAALPEVTVDYFQMQQVFLNIIINAEQAMSDANHEGTLTITSKDAGDHVELSFIDDGPGIAAENMNKLFSPFFTTKEVGKGTGLGLSICYGIMTNHGGKIYARSEAGIGATFIVELPLEKLPASVYRPHNI